MEARCPFAQSLSPNIVVPYTQYMWRCEEIELIDVFDFSAGFEPTASLKRFLNMEVEPTTLYTNPYTFIGFEQTTI
jgi:hypothetical protein